LRILNTSLLFNFERMNFQKLVNIASAIPVLGPIWSLGAGLALMAFGEENEANYCARLDLADLNPLKNFGDLARHIIGATLDYEKGIWLGKRPLSGQPFALSLVPGIDFYHYAIMIDGFVYHVQSDDDGETFRIDVTDSPTEINSFKWFPTDFMSSVRERCDLELFSRRFECENDYRAIPRLTQQETNCQFFIRDIFAYAAGIELSEAIGRMTVYCGTLLF